MKIAACQSEVCSRQNDHHVGRVAVMIVDGLSHTACIDEHLGVSARLDIGDAVCVQTDVS